MAEVPDTLSVVSIYLVHHRCTNSVDIEGSINEEYCLVPCTGIWRSSDKACTAFKYPEAILRGVMALEMWSGELGWSNTELRVDRVREVSHGAVAGSAAERKSSYCMKRVPAWR